MADAQSTAQAENLELIHSAEELTLMGRALAELGGSALILFDGSTGDQSDIDAGVAAYRQEAERVAAGRSRGYLEIASGPDPDIWADSARHVLSAGGMIVQVTREVRDLRGTPSVWTTMRMIQQEDERLAEAQARRP